MVDTTRNETLNRGTANGSGQSVWKLFIEKVVGEVVKMVDNKQSASNNNN